MKDIETMNTTPKTLIAAVAIAMLTPLGALADDAHHKPAAAKAAGADDLTDGEVRKVDLDAGKLTLKHADIKSLDMPAMTMVFAVKDKAMLDKLKTGDKVRFKVVNDGGKFTLTEIRPAK
jgi:Cu/Ag efflux protein CusF